LLHLKTHFPDALVPPQALNATTLNEVMIEHRHSGMEKLLEGCSGSKVSTNER
jgi:hypothetical protein